MAPAPALSPDARSAAASRVGNLSAVFALFYFVQGVCEPDDGLLAQPLRSLLAGWDWSTAQIAAFMALLGVPWAIKPLYGLLTDFVPIAGYRRKFYLVAGSAAATVCLLALATQPPTDDAARGIFWLLMITSVGVAFSDVVIDALMVETAQPLGLTGRLQAVQWGSVYAAGILTALAGGYLSENHAQQTAFALAGAMALVTTLLSLVVVREARQPLPESPQRKLGSASHDVVSHPGGLPAAGTSLRSALATPGLLAIGAFLFLWTFNPFSASVLHLHMTRVMQFHETFFGHADALTSATQMLASLAYGFYCRRLKTTTLVHLTIVLGVFSTLAYWGMTSQASALVISAAVGFTSATAVMIQLDLAARVCPLASAGTVFALLMSLSNAGSAASVWLGGYWYDAWSESFGHHAAFDLLVGVGALFTAACWLLAPALRRAVAAAATR